MHCSHVRQASDAGSGTSQRVGPRLAAIAASGRRRLAQQRRCRQAVPLPALGADLEATSVSGLSSGAFMASQFHIAHSRIVVGAGIVAGGPRLRQRRDAVSAIAGAGREPSSAWQPDGCMLNSVCRP